MNVIISHQNSDLDAIASMVAAQRLYPGAVPVVSPSLSPPVHRFLALHKDHYPMEVVSEIDASAVETVIVVDVRDRRRIRDFLELVDSAERIITWDHHPDSEHDVAAHESIVEPVGACVTLLVDRLRAEEIDFTPAEATLFLLGLYADTGRLSFSTTRHLDFDVAGYLVDKGANLRVVNRFLRQQFTPEQNQLLIALMASVAEESFGTVEVAFATASVPAGVRGMSAVVEQVAELGGHDAIFGIVRSEKNGHVQVIARSRVSYVDVGAIARALGGGGHPGAAAFNDKGGSVEAMVERIKEYVADHPFEPMRVSELMSAPVVMVEHDITLGRAREIFEERGISGAPVLRDGELCGIVSLRDVRRAALAERLDLPVSSHMTHDFVSVAADEPIEDALHLMTEHDVGRLPVVEEGAVVGILTRTDIIRSLYMKQWDEVELS